jgi:hypothetical protein
MVTKNTKRRTKEMAIKTTEAERPLRDIILHLRVPVKVLAELRPAAEADALKLTTWCTRVLVLAARERERQSRAASAPTN